MKNFSLILAAAALALGGGAAYAAPVAGSPDYIELYNTLIVDCSLPDGTVKDCEVAINEYSGRLVADGVDIDSANESFRAARQEVWRLNEPDEVFQLQIDALFEELLPDSGAIGPLAASPTV